MSLLPFHPVVQAWFTQALGAPTGVQAAAWEAIRTGKHTLIAAPTGSGKTLAAFLSAINDLVVQSTEGRLPHGVQVVYISPLKALSNDIEKNLQVPLQGIKQLLEAEGKFLPELEVAVRTGDTLAAERARMLKQPPHILVTTPESLYLLLTSVNGRKMLSTTRTLIIDEIHALVGDKRGSHLALSVERLENLVDQPLQRIGLSATQKPIEQVARFLTGNGEHNDCRIINTGHSRKLDLALEIPGSPLTAVMATEVWEEVYRKLIHLIQAHATTLIFVNTRRLAERLSHNLNEYLGPGFVLAHHGSMSKEQRLQAEQKLKSGQLRALVATASMELGIDVGSIDLVCQIGSSRSIAAFLQRVGRSGHSVHKTPKGRLFPLSLDELVECTAILDAIGQGELDRIIMPEKPLDIMAQQIVAESACQECTEDELYAWIKRAYPYRDLERKEFEEVLQMLADGFSSRRGRRGAYIYYDRVNRRIKARKGARLTAITSGGAIPDNFDYDVILEPENIFIGTLNEDFAIESIAGDVFQLGNSSWRILKVEQGKVRVEDAGGQPPSIPFWLGEAPGRTAELSEAVSRLRSGIETRLGDLSSLLLDEDGLIVGDTWKKEAVQWVIDRTGISAEAADQLVMYLATGKAALKVMPTQDRLVLERFFDEAGDMHLVIHSPFGNRLNKGWGLALRKRFCRKFNFELQAAATDDAIILSLGPTHSFPLEEVFSYLQPETVRNILVQAMLDAPVFNIRWRWNASRALAVLRRQGDRKVPPQLQRMSSEDLVAQVFPDQLACLENIAGDREVPDHPLVNQTIYDCLHEAMDIEGLEQLLQRIKKNEIEMVACDLREPSPLSHAIVNARPYAFLDDAPLEERRTLAVKSRRWLSPAEANDLGRLDSAAIEAVQQEAWPQAADADELHDALLLSGFLHHTEVTDNGWMGWMELLAGGGRAYRLTVMPGTEIWIAAERVPFWKQLLPAEHAVHNIYLPPHISVTLPEDKSALAEIVRGRLEVMGPVTADRLSILSGLSIDTIHSALYHLENEGFVFRGRYGSPDGEEWCERRLLARIHRYTLQKLRSEIQPVSPADFMRFLFHWHRLLPGQQPQGPDALLDILLKLEGFEAPVVAWEGDLLPSRMEAYDYLWLDMLCISGKISWGRFRPAAGAADRKTSSPIKTTPICLVSRPSSDTWKCLGANDTSGSPALSPEASRIADLLRQQGALFFDDLVNASRLFPSQVEEALGELINSGMVTSDSFTGLRALLVPDKYKTGRGQRADDVFTMHYAGRWSLSRSPLVQDSGEEHTRRLELVAWTLLRRYGVVFRKLAERESLAPPWRELARVYRTLEARGLIRGGRFVEGVWGEQFALPEAIGELRSVRKQAPDGTLVSLSAADPLNLTGIVTPGHRVPAYWGNRVLYRDGVPVAYLEARETMLLVPAEAAEKWTLQNALVKRTISPKLRKYLGKGIS